MATTKTETPLDILARPYNGTELKEVYNVDDKYTTGIDIATAQSASATAIDNEPGLTEEQKNNLKAAISDPGGAIDINISQPSFHDILDEVKTDYEDLQEGDTTNFPPNGLINLCPECLGDGKIQTFDADGNPTGVYIQSPLCKGRGYLAEVYILNPNGRGWIEQPSP